MNDNNYVNFEQQLHKAQDAWLEKMEKFQGSSGLVHFPLLPMVTDRHLENCRVLPNREAILHKMKVGGIAAEIGVLEGQFSKSILDFCRPKKLHLIDINLRRIHSNEKFKVEIDSGIVELHEGDSSSIIQKFPDHYFDFVYVDANHSYGGVKKDIQAVESKIKQNGFLIFNDYTLWSPCECIMYGVIPAVNAFCLEKDWEFVYFALECFMYCDVAIRRRVPPEERPLKQDTDGKDLGWPPGHFYSPLPDIEKIKEEEQKIFGSVPCQLPGIDLNTDDQIKLVRQFAQYRDQFPFQKEKQRNLRFFFGNPNFCLGDAFILYSFIRYFQPKRVIEIGSGYSSCLFLDMNEIFCNNQISYTFIDPYPQLFYSLIKKEERENIQMIPEKLEDIDTGIFSSLSNRDILFIDSTHVSKINSDVNHILFRIFPQLNPGVFIHFHDIFYPFEYPREWIYQGRAWNEAYILRAFLQYNKDFNIVFFNSYLGTFYNELLRRELPLLSEHSGSSIWLQRT